MKLKAFTRFLPPGTLSVLHMNRRTILNSSETVSTSPLGPLDMPCESET